MNIYPSRSKWWLRELVKLLGPRRVLVSEADLLAYDCDAFTIAKGRPEVVVLPETTEEVVPTSALTHC